MRIGVDGTCWSNDRGYGRFARHIFVEMVRLAPEHSFVCFVDEASARRIPVLSPGVRAVVVDTSASASSAASATGYRSPRDMLAMTRAVWKESLDVFFSPSVYTYFPLPPRLPAVVTVHDAIAERFPELTFSSRRARLFWNLKVGLAIMQAKRILTVSDYAAGEVQRAHGVKRDRIDVAVEAPAEAFRPRDADAILAAARSVGLDVSARWFIYVGGFSPHKNVPAIVRAHAAVALQSKGDEPHLLLVGTLDADVFYGDMPAIRATIAASGTEDLVHLTGFVADEPLSALHSGAIALIIPSASEGFGLPAVEAAACGAPVIATTESPLPSLLEDGGIFVNPADEPALISAMHTLASDPAIQSAMGAAAIRGASALSWETAARSALASLASAAA